MEISGSKVLVTGAASGIGRAAALAVARLGACVFLTDLNRDGLAETCRLIEEAGGKIGIYKAFDISVYADMQAFAEEIHARCGPLDILVNVAGVALFAQIEDMGHAHWEKVIGVNLWGVIHGLECFLPAMIRAGKGGHVVSVASAAGLFGLPWHVVYAGTKHAVVGISEVLRYDLRKHHIGVSVICPGAVRTGIIDSVEIRGNPEGIRKGRERFLKIALAPEKVADLIVAAIRKPRFLVITSADMRLLYFLKRHVSWLYHAVLTGVAWYMDRELGSGPSH